jgi:uncharacterized LabA/DUF88 family protein
LRVGVFLDNVNLYLQCKDRYGVSPDHAKLLEKAVDGNHLSRAIAYGVRAGPKMDGWRAALERLGYEVREKEPSNGKADWDTDLAMDVWRMIDRLDVVVLMTGDGDFVPVVNRCHELGRLVRVMSVGGSTSNALIEACDEFVPVTVEDLLTRKEVDPDESGEPAGAAGAAERVEERAGDDAGE